MQIHFHEYIWRFGPQLSEMIPHIHLWINILPLFQPKITKELKNDLKQENFLERKLLPGHTSFSAPGLTSERSQGTSSWENPLINPIFY